MWAHKIWFQLEYTRPKRTKIKIVNFLPLFYILIIDSLFVIQDRKKGQRIHTLEEFI